MVWEIETINNSADITGSTSIAIDESGKIHISYHNQGFSTFSSGLIYTNNIYGSWQNEIIEKGMFTGGCSSLAIDSDNKIHISYDVTQGLKYVTNKTGSWEIETLDEGTFVGSDNSLVIDSKDEGLLICNRNDAQRIKELLKKL